MPMHKTSIRLSDPSKRKLDDLTALYGSQTRTLEAAILTLWYAEKGPLVVKRWLMVNDRYGEPHMTTPEIMRQDCRDFGWPIKLSLRHNGGEDCYEREYYVDHHGDTTLRRIIPDHA